MAAAAHRPRCTSGSEEVQAELVADKESDYLALGMRVLDEEQRRAAEFFSQHHTSAQVGHTDHTASTSTPLGETNLFGAQDRLNAEIRREQIVQAAREELLRQMRERFLRGEEHDWFDYASLCDLNPHYDDLDQEGRDEEERWFDDDDDA